MQTIDPASSALTYRVSQAERKSDERCDKMEASLAQLHRVVQTLIHELAMGRCTQRKENQAVADRVVGAALDPRDIVVPLNLKIKRAVTKKGKGAGGGNRNPRVVAKRWAMWKAQLAVGYTPEEVAQAWGCNRTTINNAQKNNFRCAHV